MKTLRAIIDAARDGKPLSLADRKLLGDSLDIYWVDKRDRCRKSTKCDALLDGLAFCAVTRRLAAASSNPTNTGPPQAIETPHVDFSARSVYAYALDSVASCPKQIKSNH